MKKAFSVTLMVAICISSLFLFALASEEPQLGYVDNSANPANGAVALKLFQTYQKAGYATDGFGARNTGRGTLSVRVPYGSYLVDAWLYWEIMDASTPTTNHDIITVDGFRVVGTLVGKGPDPCWGPAAVTTSYVYRAQIRPELGVNKAGSLRGGAYGITVGGMAGNSWYMFGEDPWDTPPTANWMKPSPQRVGLVVIYRGGSVPAGSIVQLFDGYYMQAGGAATFTYNWPARASGGARFSALTGDGQYTGLTSNLDYGGTVIDQPILNGGDSSLRSKAYTTGSLSDTDTYIVSSLTPMGGGPKTITWNMGSDCISWSSLVFWTTSDSP